MNPTCHEQREYFITRWHPTEYRRLPVYYDRDDGSIMTFRERRFAEKYITLCGFEKTEIHCTDELPPDTPLSLCGWIETF